MRKVRIATASFLMEDTPHTVEQNLVRAKEYIHQASGSGARVICLPETVTTNGVKDMILNESVSGKWHHFFSEAAQENNIAVLAPFYSMENGRLYNQVTAFSKKGRPLGHYRKAQPTGIEAQGVVPGSEFPVIDLGFMKIGVMICMDIYFPEIPRIYALRGADVIFWPTVTHGPTQAGLEIQLRARAMDNSIHIVESNLAGHPPYAPYKGRFYPGNARIVDFNGDIIAQTGRRDGLAIADIDLDERRSTTDVLLITDPDNTRGDIEALARMDLYAKEYAEIATTQKRYYDSLHKNE